MTLSSSQGKSKAEHPSRCRTSRNNISERKKQSLTDCLREKKKKTQILWMSGSAPKLCQMFAFTVAVKWVTTRVHHVSNTAGWPSTQLMQRSFSPRSLKAGHAGWFATKTPRKLYKQLQLGSLRVYSTGTLFSNQTCNKLQNQVGKFFD